MVRDQWTNLIDGGINYGAPAHGGELKVVETKTKEKGETVKLANLEINHCGDYGIISHAISIPASKLRPLIDYLTEMYAST